MAADNSVALKLYRKAGYEVTQQTDDGVCHCIMSRLLKAFLGHPVWYKMTKQLPVPEALATVKPSPVCIPMAVAAGQDAAAAAALASAAPNAAMLAAGSEAAAVAAAEVLQAAELECELKIPAHNPNGQPAIALSPCPSSVKEAVQAQPVGTVEGGVGRKLSMGSVGTADVSGMKRSRSDAGCEGGRRRSSNCGGGGRERSSSDGAGGQQQQQQQQAAPLLALQLVRSLSNSVVAANTVAAASLVHMIRRTSENESSQAGVAVLAA